MRKEESLEFMETGQSPLMVLSEGKMPECQTVAHTVVVRVEGHTPTILVSIVVVNILLCVCVCVCVCVCAFA